MFLGIAISLTARLRSTASPAALFAAGEVGVWFDPSDLTTLFQDSAGTTPVTAAGQPVGLMLDKSKGSTFGADIIFNGDFSQGSTGWFVGANVTISGGVANFAAGSGILEQLVTTEAGRAYKVTATAAINSNFCMANNNAGNNNVLPLLSGGNSAAARSGTFSYIFVAAGTTSYISFTASGAGASTIDNVSVIPLPLGNHATQATSAQRPTYGIHPYSGVRNLQVQTENFSSASWTKNACTVSIPSTPAPARGGGYGRITSAGSFAALKSQFVFAPLTQYTVSGVVRRVSGLQMTIIVEGAGNPSALLDFGTGVFVRNFCTGTVTAIDADTYFVTITFTTPAVTIGFVINWWVGVYSGVSTAGQAFDLSAPQIELGSTATAYQKVVTQYEITEAGVPSVHYIGFDGVDDGMVTSAINFLATNAVTVFAGVRKLSDAARGMVVELGAALSTSSFQLNAPTSALTGYQFLSNGGTSAAATTALFPAPATSVITGLANTVSPVVTLRCNGVQVDTSSAGQGAGNYANAILYIGRRGGSSLPFNGNLYTLIIRGAQSTAGQITSTETFVNGKTGAY